LLVSFSLGELGDGLNIFQGIYLVGIGWNEGSVGLALSLMGLTALIMQPAAGDWVDKTKIDRRVFLTVASVLTAASASSILLVRQGNRDHALIFITKVVEGLASSFIGPCLAALTLANFGPNHFDAIMASNIFWGHVGSVLAAIVAGLVAYLVYPNIKFCFLVIGASALVAVIFVQYLPQGDQLMGRGFLGKVAMDENGEIEQLESDESTVAVENQSKDQFPPQASAYLDVFLDSKTCILCFTGFFFQYGSTRCCSSCLREQWRGIITNARSFVSPFHFYEASPMLTSFSFSESSWGAGTTASLAGRPSPSSPAPLSRRSSPWQRPPTLEIG
jgi:MFS family permease